ncbi:Hsp20/alpha crystallin family protein [Maridesulfovibrio bastinii]|jgi:HSP20 family molecular chaperone IbpA|uniref:Hsp20/alpha crystallin family protein n=1 Tax=Maridesulfovibrio bastinii TaxID=47157 RepID=UPI0004023D27|nr:Hsp20/alpha crystallin family protein [Maridesulfovibrio bastinii]
MTNEIKNNEEQLEKFRPATDIIEKEEGLFILMDMPGVTKENLNIDLDENSLTVSGKAYSPKEENEKFIDREFADGEYVRSFTVADVVDRENIKASLKNGVLELFLPKVPEVQPKRIEITSA